MLRLIVTTPRYFGHLRVLAEKCRTSYNFLSDKINLLLFSYFSK